MYENDSAADFGAGPQPGARTSASRVPSRRTLIACMIPVLFFATFPAAGLAWLVTNQYPSFTMWTNTFMCSSPYHLAYDLDNSDTGAIYQCVSGASSQPVDKLPIIVVHAVLFALPIYALLGILVLFWWRMYRNYWRHM
jgi:hypothetical protein